MPTLDDFLVRVAALAPLAPLHPYLHLVAEPDDPIVEWMQANGRDVTRFLQGSATEYTANYCGVIVRVTVNRRIG